MKMLTGIRFSVHEAHNTPCLFNLETLHLKLSTPNGPSFPQPPTGGLSTWSLLVL